MLRTTPNLALNLEPQSVKSWTVEDYRRMSERGILSPIERTELINGQIVMMVAKGAAHVTALCLLANILRDRLENSALVRVQDPIFLDDWSEPEPDLAIVKGSILDYAERHPGSQDVELVVEVADSTLKHDCEVKDKIYAQVGISDYWVLDVKNRKLHVYRNPTSSGYTSHLIISEPNAIAPLSFPNLKVALEEILTPIT